RITLYPNPASNELFVEGVELGQEYQVLDLNGRKLVEGECDSSMIKLDLSRLETGAYFLLVGNDTFKFLKSK
ncbi:MAG: T9SS type A sorting domain-containing protein, partial [Crocinitomicaceae bacterium]